MIKRPAMRVRDYAHLLPAVRAEILADLEEVAALLPVTIGDFEVTGSYARGRAQLHSDLDVNLAGDSLDGYRAIRRSARESRDEWRRAIARLKEMWRKWGMRIDLAVEAPTVRAITVKQCYRMRAGTWHHRDLSQTYPRMDKRLDGEWYERPRVLVGQPRLEHGWFDEDQNFVRMTREDQDPYFAQVETWAARYGPRLLRYGATPETAWMTRASAR